MNHFEVRDGELACEGVALSAIAEAVGTPVYVYSTATIERNYTVFRDAMAGIGRGDALIAYAVKANSNLSVLKTLADLGAGADTVSEGEVRRALAAGVPSIGEITLIRPSSCVTSMPTPPNWPLVVICMSL